MVSFVPDVDVFQDEGSPKKWIGVDTFHPALGYAPEHDALDLDILDRSPIQVVEDIPEYISQESGGESRNK